MGREKREIEATYRPMPYNWRFWLYSDSCYTEAELNFREWIIRARANSGIHSDYLVNPSSWFASDDQALVNVYEKAWFYSNAYRTRNVLTQDDFHVQPIDSQRLEWPDVFELMQHVGDYLLLRNQQLPPEQLNQPMNFVLLDVNNMLRGLSQNHNIQQVKEQLDLITRYVRSIEKNISPLVGSDRLFLVNFRKMVDSKIQPHLDQKLETQLLRDKLGELSKEVRRLSTERNRVLHFALSLNPVNPHPYEFQMPVLTDSSAYPTQAAKECADKAVVDPNYPIPKLHLTSKQIKHCAKLQLITDSDEVLDYYGKAISDLSELQRFQQVIHEISDLLGQAGEVYTVHQFKDQMLTLLGEMNRFIVDSGSNINEIIDANTQAYHKAIQREQDLSLFNKLFSSKMKLDTYIKNQDTLSQFPSTSSDLANTESKLKAKVSEVITHLSNPRIEGSSLEALSGQAHELNKLIGSMHNWISTQHELKGLPVPEVPAQISTQRILQTPSHPLPTGHTITTEPIHYPSLFMNSNAQNSTITCPPNIDSCSDHVVSTSQSQNASVSLALLVLLPVGALLLFLLVYKLTQKNEASDAQELIKPTKGSPEKFNLLKTEFEDLLIDIQRIDSLVIEDNTSELSFILDDYKDLLKQAQSGIFDVRALKSNLEELREFHDTLYNNAKSQAL